MVTHILTGDDVKERKPALEGYRLVVTKTGLPAAEILYVGDRVDADIKPAKQVGMATCLAYSQSDEADYCVQSFDELIALVERNHTLDYSGLVETGPTGEFTGVVKIMANTSPISNEEIIKRSKKRKS